MYESGEKGRRQKKPNQMKDANRLREAKKQVEIVDNRHDMEVLPAIHQALTVAISKVEDNE